VTKDGLVINELAMRPHNSGHWTQDGSVTSQFENHLRSVIGLPLGATSLTGSAIASVNVFGGEASLDPLESLAEALSVEDAHVHLYGKTPRPGRKLGHVTVVGGDAGLVRRQAWRSAMALGTPLPHALEKGAR
jgi:5-(carboxyamino)imidazole ribonucleotide synthase